MKTLLVICALAINLAIPGAIAQSSPGDERSSTDQPAPPKGAGSSAAKAAPPKRTASPSTFVPSEKVPADTAVAFPADI